MHGHMSDESKQKISNFKKGVPSPKKGMKFPQFSGKNHWKFGNHATYVEVFGEEKAAEIKNKMSASRIGRVRKPFSKQAIRNLRESHKYLKGKTYEEFYGKGKAKIICEKMRKSMLGKPHMGLKGRFNPRWKGDDVSYQGLHQWAKRNLGTTYECEFCRHKTKEQTDLANIRHTYERKLTNWLHLCRKCHKQLDYGRVEMINNCKGET